MSDGDASLNASAQVFIGTWRPTSGTVTVICDGGGMATSPVTDFVQWYAGIEADIAQASGRCLLQANIVGLTANALPNQQCDTSDTSGKGTITFSVYLFSVRGDGRTAREIQSGTVTMDVDGGAATCSYSQGADYEKIAN